MTDGGRRRPGRVPHGWGSGHRNPRGPQAHCHSYTTTARRFELDVVECPFVDNIRANVDGAEAVGVPGSFSDHTLVVANCNRLLELLDLS